VKAAPEVQHQLVEVGRIDTEIVRLTRQLSSLESVKQVADLEEQLHAAREARRLRREEVDGFHADVTRADSDVELVNKRIAHDIDLLNQSTSAKDAQGLEHELGTLRERLSVLEEVELELMEKLEDATRALDEASSLVESLETRLAEARSRVESETAALTESRNALNAQRSELVATLPDDLVALYDRQRERYGHGVSVLKNGMSTASGVVLTESDLHDIRHAAPDDVVMCPDSNAILIREQ
jgi:uncharacterized protein